MEKMTCNEAVRAIMKEEGVTQTQLAEKLGLKTQGSVSLAINSTRMSFLKFSEILDAMGYAVVVGKRGKNGEVAPKIEVK